MSFNTTTFTASSRPAPIQPVYAVDYEGEWVNYQLGDRLERKFISPTKNFHRANGRAIVFGNGPSRQRWPISKFNHANSYKRLTNYNILYGCNKAYTEQCELDFLVLTHRFMGKDIPKDFRTTVYTTPEVQRAYKDMNLIPLYHRFDAGASAAMLAAFHGAKQVYLFGFDGQDNPKYNNNIYAGTEYYGDPESEVSDREWHQNLYKVIAGYRDVEFLRVDINPPNARMLSILPNYKLITFNEFVSLADL